MGGLCMALVLGGAMALLPKMTAAAEPTFVSVSDVHLDPFTGTDADSRLLVADVSEWPAIYSDVSISVATYGSDANVPLLDAMLGDAAQRVPSPDFVVYAGDSVVHRLADRVRAVDAGAGQEQVTDMAVKITAYLARRLSDTFADVPVLFALGNTDAGCGDYQVEPAGRYLARTFPVMRTLVGADLLEPDAEATWRAGGYYAARHPTIARTTVIVLNTVLWSPKYENRCDPAGGERRAPGDAMLAWLQDRLAAAGSAGERVWLIYHVPAGVDAYSTAHSKPGDATCAAHTVAFWREPYATAFANLMTSYGAIVATAFSGHIHRDSWRLFSGSDGTPVTFESIVPSVSPIFGNAPAYQVFAYDTSDGPLLEKTTFAVTDLPKAASGEAAVIEELYAFTNAYRLAPFGASSLADVTAALAHNAPSSDRTLYAKFYGSGHGDDPETDWPVYGCAPGAVTAEDFDACRCRAR